jgi:hypothetical protein
VTTVLPPTTAPKIVKQYRRLWQVNGLTAYSSVSAEGHELMIIHADRSASSSIVGGWCPDCAFGPECTWPDCPRRSQTGKGAETVDPFRAIPPLPRTVEAPPKTVQDVPDKAVEPGAVPAVDPAAESTSPPVPDYVQRAAKALALDVWRDSVLSRARYFSGIFPLSVDLYLNHAIDMGWVVPHRTFLAGMVVKRPPE